MTAPLVLARGKAAKQFQKPSSFPGWSEGTALRCAITHRGRANQLVPKFREATRQISEIQKFRLPTDPNHSTDSPRPVPKEGRWPTSSTRGGMQWTRQRARRARPD